MAHHTDTFTALAAQDAASAYARAALIAKSDEAILRDYATGQRAAALRFLKLAQQHRDWRKAAAYAGGGVLGFYPDRIPGLMQGFARHRRAERAARVRLAAMVSAQASRKAA